MSEIEKLINDSNKNIQNLQDQIILEKNRLKEYISKHLFEKACKKTNECGLFSIIYYLTFGRFLHPDQYLLICKIIKIIEEQTLENFHKA